MNKYRVIDARKTAKAQLFPDSIMRLPFELQSKQLPGAQWTTIPGCWYPTKEAALKAVSERKD